MEKYIKAAALIDDLRSYAEANKGTYHEEGFNNAITVVEDQPPADVVDKERYAGLLAKAIIVCNAWKEYQAADMVEVVRCKDCKHRIIESNDDWCECTGCDINPEGFCEEGERREYGEIH